MLAIVSSAFSLASRVASFRASDAPLTTSSYSFQAETPLITATVTAAITAAAIGAAAPMAVNPPANLAKIGIAAVKLVPN